MSTRRDNWAREFGALAAETWSPKRVHELLGDKDLAVTLPDGALLLRAIGLLDRDAQMPPDRRRKFFQLNHMLRLIRPPLEELAADGPLQLVDAGCGRSYLTIALAWCCANAWNLDVRILGVDRNDKLIDDCRRRAQMAQATNHVRFVAADLDDVALADAWDSVWHDAMSLDGVIALHACDTATDRAIAIGVASDARLVAVAPCCQAELAAGWAASADPESAMAPIHDTPHLRRELAATITDSMRALLLQSQGYEVRVVEFVAAHHTPKNTLIRGVRRTIEDPKAWREYERLRDSTGGVPIILEQLLRSARD